MKKTINRIFIFLSKYCLHFIAVTLLVLGILAVLQTHDILTLKEDNKRMQKEIDQIKLDYQFLKYNKEQLEEIR